MTAAGVRGARRGQRGPEDEPVEIADNQVVMAGRTNQTVITTNNDPSATVAPHEAALRGDNIGPRIGPSNRASTGSLLPSVQFFRFRFDPVQTKSLLRRLT